MRHLIIETSTERGIVACIDNSSILFSFELPFGLNQSKYLLPQLAQALSENKIKGKDLASVGVGVGPGSYTGIRIGVAVAQSLAYAWRLPLIGVCSLNAFVASEEGEFVSLFDARVGGVYVRKATKGKNRAEYISNPVACPLDEFEGFLDGIKRIATPYAKNIKAKLDQLYPLNNWIWEEVSPSIPIISNEVNKMYELGNWKKNAHLELLYLRETEAERERNNKTDKQ